METKDREYSVVPQPAAGPSSFEPIYRQRTFEEAWDLFLSRHPNVTWTGVEKEVAKLFWDVGRLHVENGYSR